MSQTNQLLTDVWLLGQSITPMQAYSRYGILALHSRAAEARSLGYDVRCQIRTGNGRRWGEYRLQAPGLDFLK